MESELKIMSVRIGKTLYLMLEGELNTNTALELDRYLDENLDKVENIDIHCKELKLKADFKVLFMVAKLIKAWGGNIDLWNPNSEICKDPGMDGISRPIESKNLEED